MEEITEIKEQLIKKSKNIISQIDDKSNLDFDVKLQTNQKEGKSDEFQQSRFKLKSELQLVRKLL